MTVEATPTHLSPAALDRVLHAAVLAPSSHNTQPWLFGLEPGYVELVADRTRSLPVADPDDRELTISCGAALFNLLLAARQEGTGAIAELLPQPEDPDLLARVRLHNGGPALGEGSLYAAIGTRRTHRGEFVKDRLPADLAAVLIADADVEGAYLAILDQGRPREYFAELVAQADRMQWSDPRWRRELALWMHPRRRGDGLPLAGPIVPAAHAIVAHRDLGRRRATNDFVRVEQAPFAAVITTVGDTAEDWLVAGQAMQRVLLRAAASGLQAMFINQPLQVPELRLDASAAAGSSGIAQVAFLLGQPTALPPRTPRRPVTEVVIASDAI